MNSKLFSPFTIGQISLKNRIVMPAMHLGMCENGVVSEDEIRFYEERAEAGVALVMVGLCNTWVQDNPDIRGVLELSDDSAIESMTRLNAAIHGGGARSAAQLSPLFGYNNPAVMPDEPLLEKLLDSIGQAARRAQLAGFDFVELMLSGGSLLSHLLSSHHNQSGLENYSGSLENRMRAPLEAMRKIAEYSRDMPVIVRMHGHEYLENGYGLAEAAAIAKMLEAAGAVAINVTVAGHRTKLPQITRQRSARSFCFLGRNIRDAVRIPVFYGSRIRNLEDAYTVLGDSGADAITVGRALIADPLFAQRLAAEEKNHRRTRDEGDVVNCMACCNCLDMAFTKKPVQCSVNPLLQRSGQVNQLLSAGETSKVLVAGSGPAGLHAAILFARKGARVQLIERGAELGGKWRRLSQLNSHGDTMGALAGTIETVRGLPIEIKTHTELTPELVQELRPDVLVLATGAVPRRVELPGLHTHPRVVHVSDLLETDLTPDFQNAVIVGGNAAGVTMALHLAEPGFATTEAIGYLKRFGSEQWAAEALGFAPQKKVTVLKRRGFFGKGMGRATRWTAMQELELFGVETLDKVQYDEVTKEGIWIVRGKETERRFLPADLIVLATGFEPAIAKDDYVDLVPRIYQAGDARQIGNITSAVHSIYQEQ